MCGASCTIGVEQIVFLWCSLTTPEMNIQIPTVFILYSILSSNQISGLQVCCRFPTSLMKTIKEDQTAVSSFVLQNALHASTFQDLLNLKIWDRDFQSQ